MWLVVVILSLAAVSFSPCGPLREVWQLAVVRFSGMRNAGLATIRGSSEPTGPQGLQRRALPGDCFCAPIGMQRGAMT